MTSRNHPATGRARRGGIIASLAALVAVLAGCGASSSEYAAEPASGGDVAPQEAGAPGVDQDAAAAEDPLASTAERSVIVTGAMYMTVKDPIAAAERSAGIVQNAGGRIDARNEIAPDAGSGGSATLTLRIPSAKLDAVVADLGELGTVDQYTTDSYDVTNEVTDLESRISTLRASTARIEALLLEAKDISDIITLEDELDGRQAELESLEAHQRGLADQVSMSTIDLSLTTEPVVIVEVDDSPQNFWDGLVSGWGGLVAFVSLALILLGMLLPWLAVTALLAVGVTAALRARRSRIARRAAASSESAELAATPAPEPEPAKS